MKGTIETRIDQQQAHIRFEHPAGNSLPSALLKEMSAALQKADQNPAVKVIIISSAGKGAFCGGASLTELKTLQERVQAEQFFMGFATLINTLRQLSKFVIARVHGKIVGGGVGLVAACDYAIAQNTASVKLSELSIGLGPYVIEPAVSRKIGGNAFAQLSLEAHTWKSALWGLEKGLFAKVVENTSELDQEVNAMANQLAGYDALATKTLRELHWKDTAHWEELLVLNAKITGNLALGKATQQILKSL